MGITVLSSANASSSTPLAALTGGISSEALPGDFAALLGDQLSALLTETQLQTEAATAQEPTLVEDLANLVALVSNKRDTLAPEDLKKETEPAMSPEQLAALAALNPATSQTLPNLPQNPLPTSVDRDILTEIRQDTAATGVALEIKDDKKERSLLAQNPLGTTALDSKGLPAVDHSQTFASTLRAAQNPSLPTPARPLAAIAAEAHLANRSEAANIAAEMPAASVTPTSFASALNTPSTATPSHAPEQAVTLNVPTPIHETRWAQDFGEKIVWMTKSEQQTAQISINPPQLGPMQISINLHGDQASAIFASPHAEVRQAIEDAMPRLREMLSAAGISLGDANVGAQLPQQNRDNAPQFSQNNPNGARFLDENAILGDDSKVSSHSATLPIQRGRGLVDLFA